MFIAGCLFFSFFLTDSAQALEDVTLQLKWLHQFQFAGYYAAKEKGYYKKAGLTVTIREGGTGISPVEEVIKGNAQFGVGGAELLLDKSRGLRLVVLGSIFQHSPSAVLSLEKSGISSPHDLIGRNVMLSESGEMDIWAMFLNEGISRNRLKIIKPTWDLDDLINGRIDATAAYLTNSPFLLMKKGIKYTLIRPRTYGVDFYGDCFFTSDSYLDDHKEIVKKFRQASLKGWEYAMAHPNEIIDLIINEYTSNKTREHLEFEAEAMKELIIPQLVEIGHTNPGRWKHMAETYSRLGMLPRDFSLEGFFYDPDESPDLTWLIRGAVAAVLAAVFGFVYAGWLYLFNRKLQTAVDEKTRDIEKARNELDIRVQERTKDLLKANMSLKNAKEELEAAYRTKYELLVNINHELKTPMNAVIGMTEVALESDLSLELRRVLESVREAADRLLKMINDVIFLSNLEAGKVQLREQPFSLKNLLEATCQDHAKEASSKKLLLDWVVKDDVPPIITGDFELLRRLLSILIGNAVKFTESGSITVKTSLIESSSEKTALTFEIVDTGIGISADFQKKLFNGLSQADGTMTRGYGGLGLGLAIAPGLVELMKGSISVRSQEGHGSTFTVNIQFNNSGVEFAT